MSSKRLPDAAIRKYRAQSGERLEYWDQVQPGLHLRVSCDLRRTAKGHQRRVWYVRYRVNGRQRRQRLGEFPGVSVKTARERAEKVMAKVHDDRDPQAERRKERADATGAKDRTVANLVERFLEYQVEQRVKSRFE